MSDDEDDALARLDARMDIVAEAHFRIYALHRELVGRGLADQETRDLLDESRRIALDEAPAILRGAREAALERGARRLLDPSATAHDRVGEREIAGAEDALDALLQRLERIARELDKRRGLERG